MAKRKKSNWKTYLIVAAVVVIAAGLGYTAYQYILPGAGEREIVVCNPQNPSECLWQAHIHALIIPYVCGEEMRLPVEAGRLSKSHTHEEKNLLHWHDQLPYDPESKEIIDKTSLTLGSSFDEIGVQFNSTCFFGKCNGDLCSDGTQGTVKMFTKEKGGEWAENTQYRNYVWKGGDMIYISFDSRTSEEILQFLQATRFTFPFSGAG